MIIIKRTAAVAGAVLHFIDGVHDYVDLLLFLHDLTRSGTFCLLHVPPLNPLSRSLASFFAVAGRSLFYLVYYLIFLYHIIGVVGMPADLTYTPLLYVQVFQFSLNNHNNNSSSRVVPHTTNCMNAV